MGWTPSWMPWRPLGVAGVVYQRCTVQLQGMLLYLKPLGLRMSSVGSGKNQGRKITGIPNPWPQVCARPGPISLTECNLHP
jgi:hypothetical protein